MGDEENKLSFKNVFLKEKEFKTSEFIGAIIANIIFLYIVNNLLNWNLSFIAPTFSEVLWIFNFSIILNILANIGFLIYQKGWFRTIVQIILNIIGFIVVYSLYTVFPFVFQNVWFAYVLQFALIIAMIALVIATVVELVRFILIYILKINN
ncbi:MAG: hypothetical protein ACP5C3_06960 [Methanomicrobiales archaeon]